MTNTIFLEPPPKSGGSDAKGVSAAACYLQVAEFRVFELAWRDWHGAEPDVKTVEPHFARYMFHQTVPSWVRHYVRKVLARAEDTGFTHAGTDYLLFSRDWWKANEVDLVVTALVVDLLVVILRLGLG